jgi:hypothetical protein
VKSLPVTKEIRIISGESAVQYSVFLNTHLRAIITAVECWQNIQSCRHNYDVNYVIIKQREGLA